MAVTQTQDADATYNGQPVEVLAEESHYDKEMREVRLLDGDNAGATTWAFVEDLE